MVANTNTLRCPHCGLTKPTTEFYLRSTTYKDGSPRYQSHCKHCSNITRNKYRARIRAQHQRNDVP